MVTPTQPCHILECRGIIADYLSRYWMYNTTSFGECISCPYARYPNFPPDWFSRWYTEDIFITNSIGGGQNCAGNPRTGDITSCQESCLRDATCVGFARKKNIPNADSNGECWLKNNTQSNPIVNDTVWHTVIFNATL